MADREGGHGTLRYDNYYMNQSSSRYLFLALVLCVLSLDKNVCNIYAPAGIEYITGIVVLKTHSTISVLLH